jgi:hypothetical protein
MINIVLAVMIAVSFPSMTAPLTPGSVVDRITINTTPAVASPAGITLSLAGRDAGKFVLSSTTSPADLLVGSVALIDGQQYDVTVLAGSLSIDDTRITPPDNASIYTTEGVWSFGQLLADGVNAVVLLNGAKPTPQYWAGSALQVHGGKIYLLRDVQWRVWQGGSFAASGAP